MKKIIHATAILTFMSSFAFANITPIRIGADDVNLIQKFRCHYTSVWYMDVCVAGDIYADYYRKYIALHHLSANAMHIMNMHNDVDYCANYLGRLGNYSNGATRIGGIEENNLEYFNKRLPSTSVLYKNISQENNPEAMYRNIIAVMQKADQDINQVSSEEIVALRLRTEKYRTHRKMVKLYTRTQDDLMMQDIADDFD